MAYRVAFGARNTGVPKYDLMVYNDMLHLQRLKIYIVQDVSVLGITFVGNVKQHSTRNILGIHMSLVHLT